MGGAPGEIISPHPLMTPIIQGSKWDTSDGLRQASFQGFYLALECGSVVAHS